MGAWHLLAAQPLAWGVQKCEIDASLLSAGTVRVLALEAVMPDGTAVWHNARDALDGALELDLAEHSAALEAGPLSIYLTLPWERAMRNPAVPARFRGVNDLPVADEVSDSDAVDMPRLRPQLGLSAGPIPPSLFQHLRLGTVVREHGLTRLGDELPPLRRLGPEHALWQRAWALAAQLRAKAAYLARQGQATSSQVEDRIALLENKARLTALLTPLTALEAVLQTPMLHPYALYLALCEASGPLATLQAGAMPPLPPAYDHGAPRGVFEALLQDLEHAIDAVSQEHRIHTFDLRDGVFTLPLQPQWLEPRLVVGLRGPSERDMLSWMEAAVIGSASVWGSLRERRVLGAPRSHIEAAPALGLRQGSGYTLFEIESHGASLQPEETLQLANLNAARGAPRPTEVVLFAKG
jgi:type VI secretion system protein ImpJ